ncbi:MAG TPA: hypothetical protein VIH00_09935 [Candidatus Limnocylindrales bacterium]
MRRSHGIRMRESAVRGVAVPFLMIALAGCASGGASPSAAAVVPSASEAATTTPAATPSPTPAPSPTPLHNPAAVVEGTAYAPAIDPAGFTTDIDNPYLPLVVGTTMTYEGGGEQDVVTVTPITREVMGVTVLAVRDKVYEDGELIEDTEDWFAQDMAGNVWYFGEETAECEGGKAKNAEGAWTGGVDGAQPGIVMLAEPRVGDAYRQEFYAGVAEDMGRVIKLDATVTVPTGTYDGVLVTEDFTPVEPDVLENKAYAPGIGLVQEGPADAPDEVKLVRIETGGPTTVGATAFEPCQE